jgi:hypothetical protein
MHCVLRGLILASATNSYSAGNISAFFSPMSACFPPIRSATSVCAGVDAAAAATRSPRAKTQDIGAPPGQCSPRPARALAFNEGCVSSGGTRNPWSAPCTCGKHGAGGRADFREPTTSVLASSEVPQEETHPLGIRSRGGHAAGGYQRTGSEVGRRSRVPWSQGRVWGSASRDSVGNSWARRVSSVVISRRVSAAPMQWCMP